MALAARLTAAEGRTETATGLSEGVQQRRRDAAARSEATNARQRRAEVGHARHLRRAVAAVPPRTTATKLSAEVQARRKAIKAGGVAAAGWAAVRICSEGRQGAMATAAAAAAAAVPPAPPPSKAPVQPPQQPPLPLPQLVEPKLKPHRPQPGGTAVLTAAPGPLPCRAFVHSVLLQRLLARRAAEPHPYADPESALAADARACAQIVSKKTPVRPLRTKTPAPYQQSPNQKRRRKRAPSAVHTQPPSTKSANALRRDAKRAAMAERALAANVRPQRVPLPNEVAMAKLHAAQAKAAAATVAAHAPSCLIHDSHASACTCAYHAEEARAAAALPQPSDR